MTEQIGPLSTSLIIQAAKEYGTPIYLYDENTVTQKCRELQAMPNAFGLNVRYAMKANSSKALLQLIHQNGIGIDASSLNEARRAAAAGIPLSKIMLTTQELHTGTDLVDLESMVKSGMKFNVCSARQLSLIAPVAKSHNIALSMRIHPGVGSGESVTRNTGDKYSCFGVHLSIMEEQLAFAAQEGIVFDQVHVHIGSGGDPEAWRKNIDLELGFVEKYFPDATTVNFGGGFKVARMPREEAADIVQLGEYAKDRFTDFAARTGRKLTMEIEPGTYVVANAGYLLTRIMDKKQTGHDGFQFLLADGGMEVNTRPLLYGAQHPFFFISAQGSVLSSEFRLDSALTEKIVVGRCCESGDSFTLNGNGEIVPRKMADPAVDDLLLVGGCGAYCASMTPFNYNSHVQIPEILVRSDGTLQLIRKRQTLEQLTHNELPL
ncbi:MAG: diaminopimelate decarboxylase [Deltaproteobacteria bacterium]|nr:diaminopimelate decarboxylase [Deltaproteobacteria bacterium]MBN2673894.1 diaminopimelate decarboxylase [Deltaproteobacteria bacterium]